MTLLQKNREVTHGFLASPEAPLLLCPSIPEPGFLTAPRTTCRPEIPSSMIPAPVSSPEVLRDILVLNGAVGSAKEGSLCGNFSIYTGYLVHLGFGFHSPSWPQSHFPRSVGNISLVFTKGRRALVTGRYLDCKLSS